MEDHSPPPDIFTPEDPHLMSHEEKKPSWVDKFGSSFGLLVIASLLFLSSFAIIFWNENKSVIENWRLSEATRLVVSLNSDTPDSDNNGQLVHVTGVAQTTDMLSDELFYMSASAIKLQRVVEMYQWQEDTTPVNGGSVSAPAYIKVWSVNPIDSSKFKILQGHSNPAMEIRSNEYVAENVRVGGFTLAMPFITQFSKYEDYPMTPDDYSKINPEMSSFRYHKGIFYYGKNPDEPEVGDIRVRYRTVMPGREVSVIGMQDLDRMEEYHTDYSIIKLLSEERMDANTMLRRDANARDISVVWWLRFGGWVGMLVSIWLALSSFAVLWHVFPLLKGLVGYNNFEMSFFLSLALAQMTVAFAWFNFQFAFAVGLLVLSCSLVMATAFLKKQDERNQRKKKKRRKAVDADVDEVGENDDGLASDESEAIEEERLQELPEEAIAQEAVSDEQTEELNSEDEQLAQEAEDDDDFVLAPVAKKPLPAKLRFIKSKPKDESGEG